jgi:hypothetical protein
VLRHAYRLAVGQQPATGQRPSAKHRIAATALMSVLIYAVLVLVSLGSSSHETSVRAFGERPAGVPTLVFVLVLQTVLYLPMPWVFWHVMQLAFQARQDGGRLGVAYLLNVGSTHPHLRRSQLVCIGGVLYFLAICGVWIAYAARRGF